ncbi:MAG: hypothetical protein VX185_04250 [Pseudomonadota bacterium]|nr:hypothetical protein [Pseudomonadota bacterium]
MKKRIGWFALALLLTACGGDPSIEVIGHANTSNESGANNGIAAPNQPSLVVNLSAQEKRADTQALQANIWVSDCRLNQKTKLEFTAEFMLSTTVTYADVNCVEPRLDIQQTLMERFSIENAEVLSSGLTAGRLLLTTVQSRREELYYFEGSALYMGVKGGGSSYTSQELDFGKPYYPVSSNWVY